MNISPLSKWSISSKPRFAIIELYSIVINIYQKISLFFINDIFFDNQIGILDCLFIIYKNMSLLNENHEKMMVFLH